MSGMRKRARRIAEDIPIGLLGTALVWVVSHLVSVRNQVKKFQQENEQRSETLYGMVEELKDQRSQDVEKDREIRNLKKRLSKYEQVESDDQDFVSMREARRRTTDLIKRMLALQREIEGDGKRFDNIYGEFVEIGDYVDDTVAKVDFPSSVRARLTRHAARLRTRP